MFTYFTPNEMFNNLIFPLITAIISLILTYFLFEPIIGLIKKMKKYLTNQVVASILLKCRETVKKLTVFFCTNKIGFSLPKYYFSLSHIP